MALYTRSGVRRSGDHLQDLVALEFMVEMLEHPKRYAWIQVEADDAGALDDVVAKKTDGRFVYRQVKFSAYPDKEGDEWSWERLLEKGRGKQKSTPSLLQRWAKSLGNCQQQNEVEDAALYSNRRANTDLLQVLSPQGYVEYDRVDLTVRKQIEDQLGGEDTARAFFQVFRFEVDRPNLEDFEDALRQRFIRLGGEEHGWLNLKGELLYWVRNKLEPSPRGEITLRNVRTAARWHLLSKLPQQYEIPADYVPPQAFHIRFKEQICSLTKGCRVLTASPGGGKSTYLSHLYSELVETRPVIRHHYFLSLSDKTVSHRYDHLEVIRSLMEDIREQYPESLEGSELESKNPDPRAFSEWLDTCGKYFVEKRQPLILILDGLDHVWRQRQHSIKELSRLFEYLSPIPEGIVVVVGTQPVDDDQLPLQLLRESPRDEWIDLPMLDRVDILKWLEFHLEDLELPEDEGIRKYRLELLADAFHTNTEGHPLHLRYTLKALQERERPVNVEEIYSLPRCPHHDITMYYQSLWYGLTESGRQILYLMTACSFSWTTSALVECLHRSGLSDGAVREGLRQVRHLLLRDEFGWLPFHSSLLVFIAGQPEYEEIALRMKRFALEWLRSDASESIRWSYEWEIEAELGNPQPLIEGPDRQWVIDALSKSKPREDVTAIMGKSSKEALQHGRLDRVIEVGLLHDYYRELFRTREVIVGRLLDTQLAVGVDEALPNQIRYTLQVLNTEKILSWSTQAWRMNRQEYVKECLDELAERLKERGQSYPVWEGRMTAFLQVAAQYKESNVIGLAKFVSSRKNDDWTTVYARALRQYRNVSALRILVSELPHVQSVLHAALWLSGEEEMEFPFVDNLPTPRMFPLPDPDPLCLKEHEQYMQSEDIVQFYYLSFFSFLAHHLNERKDDVEKWLLSVRSSHWRYEFLCVLNRVAEALSERFSLGELPKFGWYYEQIQHLRRPEFSTDRLNYHYGFCGAQSFHRIALDVMSLYPKLEGSNVIEKEDLLKAVDTEYFQIGLWLNSYLSLNSKRLSDDAVFELIQRECDRLNDSIENFDDRAEAYRRLAALASFHDFNDEAQRMIVLTAENLLSYGYHKDILLFDAMDVIDRCHQANMEVGKDWLHQIIPSIIEVENYTDGDDTRYLPSRLIKSLVKVDNTLLEPYADWLAKNGHPDDAQEAYKTLRGIGELSEEGNEGEPVESHRGKKLELNFENSSILAEYPPDRFLDYVKICLKYPYSEREANFAKWANFWQSQGQEELVYQAVKALDTYGLHWIPWLEMFELSRSLFGRDESYPWLVKAFVEKTGWANHYMSEQSWFEKVISKVKRFYPDRWYEFIKDTISGQARASYRSPTAYGQFVRLVEYCLYMGRPEMAKIVAEKAIGFTVDSCSNLQLPSPEWLRKS